MYNSKLNEALKKVINENNREIDSNNFIWIGVLENVKARKYKYEMYWFVSSEATDEDHDENIIDNCESRICVNIKQTYSNCYLQIRNALEEDQNTKVYITDLTLRDDED